MIYNMDCIQGSKEHIADDSADLIITDPPYNLGYGGTGHRKVKTAGFGTFANDTLTEKDYRKFSTAWLREAYRILKPGRHIYVSIDWRNYPLLFWLMQHAGFRVKNCLVWDKVRMGMGHNYRFRHEFIIFAIKDVQQSKKRSARQMVPPSPKRLSSQKNRRISSRSMTDIVSIKKLPGNVMIHPTEKPIDLIVPLLLQSSEPGEMVVDFFVGSGPVPVAALENQREFIGFELSTTHYENALARISARREE